MAPTKQSAKLEKDTSSRKLNDPWGLLRSIRSTFDSAKAKIGMSRVTKLKSVPKGRQFNYDMLKRIMKAGSIDRDISTPAIESAFNRDYHNTPQLGLSTGDFEIGCQLGTGNMGRVFLARHITTSYICALKIIPKANVTSDQEEWLIGRDIQAHQNLHVHPNILCLLNWFHDLENIYLVLEYAPEGNLHDSLSRQPHGRFKEHTAAQYIVQLARALKYMHGKNIMHCDIAPDNILLGLHHEIKLATFNYGIHSTSDTHEAFRSTLDYLTPETAIMLVGPDQPHEFYSRAVTQWNIGILAYELLVGKPPFETKFESVAERLVEFDGRIKFPGHVSKGAEGFILDLLDLDVERTIGLDDILGHSWILQHVSS